MNSAGPLQKLLHLANAREALASGDLEQALNEADAAITANPTFGVARTLRAEIVARMTQDVRSESVSSVAIAPPVAAVKALPRRRAARSTKGIPVVLGMLVIVGGVGVALVASGIRFRERKAAPPTLPLTSDVTLPPPARVAVTTAAPVKPAVVEQRDAAPANGMEWASPRLTHLSVRPRWRASALRVEDAALLRDLGQGLGELWVGRLTGNEDAIFVGGTLDENDWMKLRGSIKPTGVVWRIYSNRSSPVDGPVTAATAAGFSRVKKVRYSADYSAEQFALHRSPR